MSPGNVEGHKPLYIQAAEDFRKNPGQWEAYESSGNCVILAGPGSGKTKTLTVKLARMLAVDTRPPRSIACITYNNQCARELKRRLSVLGVEDSHRVSIGTLHSFCLKYIVLPYAQLAGLPKKYPITVASKGETEILQQQAIDTILSTSERWGPRFDKYRRTHLDRGDTSWQSSDEKAAQVIEKYEALLDEQGLIDFDGMVLIGLHLVQKHAWVRKALSARFPILVVDEYQDLGYALDRIVRCLCFDAGIRLVAVGDPDQSIYGFTGADPSLLRNLAESKDVKPIHLRLNYRCGSEIIRASEAALGEARGFQPGHNDPGVVFFHEHTSGIEDQAQKICTTIIPAALSRRPGRTMGNIAILYLDRNDGDVMANAVGNMDWKYIRIDGNSPYQPSPVTYWLEDCAAWCAGHWRTGTIRLSELVRRWLSFNESLSTDTSRHQKKVDLVRFLYEHRHPDMSLNEWLNEFMRRMLAETLHNEPRLRDDKDKVENLLKVTSEKEALSSFTVSFFGGQGGSPEHINLTTLHSAKGLEYDVVIMPGLEDGRIPYYNDSDETVREKRRLFYVGLTRARHEVHLVYSGWYERYGRRFSNGRSRFVGEVERDVLAGRN